MSAETSGRPLSKDVIVGKALDLMVERGLAAVSLRRIATDLGVSAPTLYWYIANKRELLDGVAELLLRRGRTVGGGPAEGQPWWDWLEHRSRAMFQTMISVRGAPEVMAGNRPTLELLADTDSALGVLVHAGFTAPEAQQVFFVIGGYVGGMALEWHGEAARAEDAVDDSALREAVTDAERFPNLAAAVATSRFGDHLATFDYGLALLLRGLRARHAELRS